MQHVSSTTDGAGRRPVSTGAAARLVGVHTTTVWRAIREGELPAFRVGPHGHYRSQREALDAWLRPAGEDES